MSSAHARWGAVLAALLFALGTGGTVAAQTAPPELWSVQTVALRDLRQAQAAVADLRRSGFDAFTEFAMDGGLQFVRVRVGCFTSRYAAESMADTLRGRITDNAVVVEASEEAPVAGCVSVDVGFLKPVRWDEVAEPGTAPAFHMVVAGIEAHVAHTGAGWLVLQGGEPVPAVEPGLTSERFSQARVGGVDLVRQDSGAGVILCPGTLVSSVGGVAIAEQGDAVVACSLMPRGAY